ncbi:MAG: tRNA (adenosine(37)-N6)-threonylcarbamoyltransferase complex ATPase subunit type 1 TsaE [Alistipes sp.]|nr:tRNA (adenosine(37)-N6)-threonylcarbamoyltransferase complex ATPase subunit type 1 TsaE [Alistipes sp.]
MKEIVIESLEELDEVVDALLASLNGRTVVALHAPMGAGKTTLISALMRRLGSEDVVTSPTFALVNQYYTATRERVFHFDFYRINSIAEAFDMGYEEYFYSGELCLVEWPERVEQLLPDDTMVVKIEILGDTSRRFVMD